MAPNAGQHRATVSHNDDNGATRLGVRWACTCGRVGQWTFEEQDAERGAKAHEQRFTAQRSTAKKTKGPKALRDLLKFGD